MIELLSGSNAPLALAGLEDLGDRLSFMIIHRASYEKKYLDQSIYLIFRSGKSSPDAVGKVGYDSRSGHFLKHEYSGLQSVAQRVRPQLAESVPKALLYRQEEGRHLLLQSALRGQPVSPRFTLGMKLTKAASRLLQWAADWSAALGRATRADAGGLVPAWTEDFSTKFDRSGRSRQLLETAARAIWEGSEQSFPSVLAHGDFCGDNILQEGSSYGVIDWEFYDEISMPGYDILELCLWLSFKTDGYGDGNADPFRALEKVLRGRDPLAREMRRTLGRYVRQLGFPESLLPSFLAIAWAGYCIKKFRHLEDDETGHFARARAGVRKILAIPGEILAGMGDP